MLKIIKWPRSAMEEYFLENHRELCLVMFICEIISQLLHWRGCLRTSVLDCAYIIVYGSNGKLADARWYRYAASSRPFDGDAGTFTRFWAYVPSVSTWHVNWDALAGPCQPSSAIPPTPTSAVGRACADRPSPRALNMQHTTSITTTQYTVQKHLILFVIIIIQQRCNTLIKN